LDVSGNDQERVMQATLSRRNLLFGPGVGGRRFRLGALCSGATRTSSGLPLRFSLSGAPNPITPLGRSCRPPRTAGCVLRSVEWREFGGRFCRKVGRQDKSTAVGLGACGWFGSTICDGAKIGDLALELKRRVISMINALSQDVFGLFWGWWNGAVEAIRRPCFCH